MDTIGVVIPVYNVEQYLKECLDSILLQTYKKFIVILVDDGSSDKSPSICDEYSKADSRVKVIHKKNGGLSSARNAGLDFLSKVCNVDFVTFVDSDDYVSVDYLETMINTIRRQETDVVACGVNRVRGNNILIYDQLTPKVFRGNEVFHSDNIKHCYGIVPAKLYKFNLINNYRFLDGVVHEDDFFSNEFYRENVTVASINNQLYFYRDNENSIMHNLDSFGYLCGIKALLRRLYLFRKRVFLNDKFDKILYVNSIIEYFEVIYFFPDIVNYKKEYKKLLRRSFLFLPYNKSSIKFRLRIIKRIFIKKRK